MTKNPSNLNVDETYDLDNDMLFGNNNFEMKELSSNKSVSYD